jgi:hypothetical protein
MSRWSDIIQSREAGIASMGRQAPSKGSAVSDISDSKFRSSLRVVAAQHGDAKGTNRPKA